MPDFKITPTVNGTQVSLNGHTHAEFNTFLPINGVVAVGNNRSVRRHQISPGEVQSAQNIYIMLSNTIDGSADRVYSSKITAVFGTAGNAAQRIYLNGFINWCMGVANTIDTYDFHLSARQGSPDLSISSMTGGVMIYISNSTGWGSTLNRNMIVIETTGWLSENTEVSVVIS